MHKASSAATIIIQFAEAPAPTTNNNAPAIVVTKKTKMFEFLKFKLRESHAHRGPTRLIATCKDSSTLLYEFYPTNKQVPQYQFNQLCKFKNTTSATLKESWIFCSLLQPLPNLYFTLDSDIPVIYDDDTGTSTNDSKYQYISKSKQWFLTGDKSIKTTVWNMDNNNNGSNSNCEPLKTIASNQEAYKLAWWYNTSNSTIFVRYRTLRVST